MLETDTTASDTTDRQPAVLPCDESKARPRMQIRARDLWHSWGKLLCGHTPLLTIEVTRDCPLHCPGCYAKASAHTGAASLHELRGDDLVAGVRRLIDRHKPIHVSLVGGEPLLRRRELDLVLPELSRRGIVSMVVTSGVLPIPPAWSSLPRVIVTVSIDGLPPEHDERRAPATYDRVLRNIEGRPVNLHWTITRRHLQRPEYLDEYLDFWSARPEVGHILLSIYTPQRGEQTLEMLAEEERRQLAGELPGALRRHPKLLLSDGMARALLNPPASPERCLFARMSHAYTSDLSTTIEPCLLGGDPDCRQCGCAIAIALHAIAAKRLRGPLRVSHIIETTIAIAHAVNRLRGRRSTPGARIRRHQ